MEETYYEQIVRREDDRMAGFYKNAYILITVLLIAAGSFGGLYILLILGFAVLFGGYFFLLPRLHQEYEYLYMSRELSVDCIYNKESRKSCGSWNLDSMEIMAPLGSHRLDSYEKRDSAAFNFSSHIEKPGQYVIMINDSKYTRLLIEPDENLLKAIRDNYPRKVFTD